MCATRSSCARTARVDRRVRVAVDVAPQRRDAVEVGVAVGVVERAALGALDDQRVLLGPALLLRERVPEHPLVDVLRARAWSWRRTLGAGPDETATPSRAGRALSPSGADRQQPIGERALMPGDRPLAEIRRTLHAAEPRSAALDALAHLRRLAVDRDEQRAKARRRAVGVDRAVVRPAARARRAPSGRTARRSPRLRRRRDRAHPRARARPRRRGPAPARDRAARHDSRPAADRAGATPTSLRAPCAACPSRRWP